MSKLTLAVALALVTSSALAAPPDLQRQMKFARLYQDSRAMPAAPTATANPVSADELKGRLFTDTKGSTLRVAADGSWEGESPKFKRPWAATTLSGPSFTLGSAMDRQVVTFELSAAAIAVINGEERDAKPVGAFLQRLSAEQQAELATKFGSGYQLALVVVYGSLADGQVLMLMAK